MASLLARLKGTTAERDITTIDDYAEAISQFTFGGIGYGVGMSSGGIQQTLAGQATEMPPNNFVGLATQAYASNGVVFACMLVRQLVFSSVRFNWQRMRGGKPSDTFTTPDLRLLERPWTGGTTQDMLSRIIQDADLAGNAYWMRDGNELVRLRPDWMHIVVEPRMLPDGRGQVGWRKAGYVYLPTGASDPTEAVGLLPDEVMHFCPIPDPLANFRGMSWITPILREIQADHAMTRHQRKFFDNGATPNMVIKHPEGATPAKIEAFATLLQDKFGGTENAYKTLQLYPGADMTVVGKDMRQINFKEVRGGGETRVAAAAGVPPVIVGLSEGLAAATYSNYGQARRRFADGTVHPLWQNVSGSLEPLVNSPGGDVRLWYDTTDVPFLREDESDAADIAAVKAATINTYITAGYTPDSVVIAVGSGDLGLLVHSGLMSVQLQPPGAEKTPALNADGIKRSQDAAAELHATVERGRQRRSAKELTGGVINGASN